MSDLNLLLDQLPRPTVGRGVREVPTYRTCGIVGYYLAVIGTLAAGLLAGRSLLVLTLLSIVCALSFFSLAYVRMWITGHQELILLEHVWWALLCSAAALWALGLPILPYLDDVSVGLCFFLAAGRVGCLLVGCCHGLPSGFGIVYGQEFVPEGFPAHLVGVRLFPVQAIEAGGLLVIGAASLVAVHTASPGAVFIWFLVSYSVLRFGLEGVRSDRRPHFAGLSQSRWMSLAGFVVALWLYEVQRPPTSYAAVLVTAATAALAAGLAAWRLPQVERRLLGRKHRYELAQLVADETAAGSTSPVVRQTSRGLRLAMTPGGDDGQRHASLSLPPRAKDARLLCRLTVLALPGLLPGTGILSREGILHVLVRVGPDSHGLVAPGAEDELYGNVIRALQAADRHHRDGQASDSGAARRSYFVPRVR
jgi:prolipoprotein diacylglyceryltransferase